MPQTMSPPSAFNPPSARPIWETPTGPSPMYLDGLGEEPVEPLSWNEICERTQSFARECGQAGFLLGEYQEQMNPSGFTVQWLKKLKKAIK